MNDYTPDMERVRALAQMAAAGRVADTWLTDIDWYAAAAQQAWPEANGDTQLPMDDQRALAAAVLKAMQSATVTLTWTADDATGYEADATPRPRHGNHGTCATCGGGIRYHESTDHFGYVFHAQWLHDEQITDGHDAELGGPA